MEVKINREIRDYTESVFFGLSVRQFGFSMAAVIVAVVLYFILQPMFGTETVSWMCILGAAPFAALGFFQYHGLTAEQFFWQWLRSEVIEPKKLVVKSENTYYACLKDLIGRKRREEMRRRDKDHQDVAGPGEGEVQNPQESAGLNSCETDLG